ncbi:MAG: hypothetical protein UIL36_01760, partial [Turicibacter sp.]|nr:hypothetical protein [Turicibacter sp.]
AGAVSLNPDVSPTASLTVLICFLFKLIIIPPYLFFIYSYNKVEINIIIRFSFCDILLLQVYINLLIFSLLFRRR